MMSVSGHPEEPMKVGVSMIDILTGLYASTAVLAALRHRDRTGEGSSSTCPCWTAAWPRSPTSR